MFRGIRTVLRNFDKRGDKNDETSGHSISETNAPDELNNPNPTNPTSPRSITEHSRPVIDRLEDEARAQQQITKTDNDEIPNRSVNDFQSKEELKQALFSSIKGSCNTSVTAWLFSKNQNDLQELLSSETSNQEPVAARDIDHKLDWILENYNEETTEAQSLQHELRRLLVLKSYLVLDTERKESFDSVTDLASKRFDCPIALISLVDLGRQWFLSSQGLGSVRETPRKLAFCAHTIMSKEGCFVVPDATEDSRFKDSPLVTGPPDIRFYAGAPLISPEGYKLGSMCVIDTKPRTFSLEDKDYLKEFSAMAVQTLVDHRKKMSCWFNNLVRTHFPEFEVPDADELSDVSDEEAEAIIGEEKCFTNEEDHDFDDFLETTKRIPLISLLSMLQKEARAQNCPPEHLHQYDDEAESGKTTLAKPTTLVKQKRVQFAENGETGDVQTYVHMVDSWKHLRKDLWWSPEEMQEIRMETRRTVHYIRTRRPDFVQCVKNVAKSTDERTVMDNYVRLLTQDCEARGLESQVTSVLSGRRKATVKAVLQEQCECRDEANDFGTMSHCLREQSLVYTHLSRRFAEKMGQCDQIGALRACRSRWRPNYPQSMAHYIP